MVIEVVSFSDSKSITEKVALDFRSGATCRESVKVNLKLNYMLSTAQVKRLNVQAGDSFGLTTDSVHQAPSVFSL